MKRIGKSHEDGRKYYDFSQLQSRHTMTSSFGFVTERVWNRLKHEDKGKWTED